MGVACVFGIAVVIGGICTESLLAVAVGAGLLILGCIYLVTRVDKVADQATIVRYKEGNDYIQKGYVNGLQAHGHINAQELPKRVWTKIQLNESDCFFLKVLTDVEFQQKADRYSCKIDGLIMKDPFFLKCCNKMVDFTSWSKKWKDKTGYCPVCSKQIHIANDTLKSGDVVKEYKDGITQFRKRIVLTYQKLSSELKGCFKNKIDKLFGVNYSDEHL